MLSNDGLTQARTQLTRWPHETRLCESASCPNGPRRSYFTDSDALNNWKPLSLLSGPSVGIRKPHPALSPQHVGLWDSRLHPDSVARVIQEVKGSKESPPILEHLTLTHVMCYCSR